MIAASIHPEIVCRSLILAAKTIASFGFQTGLWPLSPGKTLKQYFY